LSSAARAHIPRPNQTRPNAPPPVYSLALALAASPGAYASDHGTVEIAALSFPLAPDLATGSQLPSLPLQAAFALTPAAAASAWDALPAVVQFAALPAAASLARLRAVLPLQLSALPSFGVAARLTIDRPLAFAAPAAMTSANRGVLLRNFAATGIVPQAFASDTGKPFVDALTLAAPPAFAVAGQGKLRGSALITLAPTIYTPTPTVKLICSVSLQLSPTADAAARNTLAAQTITLQLSPAFGALPPARPDLTFDAISAFPELTRTRCFNQPLTFYPANSQTLRLAGLYSPYSDTFLATATVDATLFDAEGDPVFGLTTVRLAYVDGTPATYESVINGLLFDPPPGTYLLVVTADADGALLDVEIPATVAARPA
jgi:hypothetical protein